MTNQRMRLHKRKLAENRLLKANKLTDVELVKLRIQLSFAKTVTINRIIKSTRSKNISQMVGLIVIVETLIIGIRRASAKNMGVQNMRLSHQFQMGK